LIHQKDLNYKIFSIINFFILELQFQNYYHRQLLLALHQLLILNNFYQILKLIMDKFKNFKIQFRIQVLRII